MTDQPPAPLQDPAKPKWYHNVWFTLFMLFFILGPLGLPLVWKNPRFSRRAKIILSLATVLYTLWLVDAVIRIGRAVMHEVEQLQSTFQF